MFESDFGDLLNLLKQQFILTITVDGAWTTWISWSTCTVTCGGGSQERTRTCTNPSPQYGGANCPSVGWQQQACNTQTCISKSNQCYYIIYIRFYFIYILLKINRKVSNVIQQSRNTNNINTSIFHYNNHNTQRRQ